MPLALFAMFVDHKVGALLVDGGKWTLLVLILLRVNHWWPRLVKPFQTSEPVSTELITQTIEAPKLARTI